MRKIILAAVMVAVTACLGACGAKDDRKETGKEVANSAERQKEDRRREFLNRNTDCVITEKSIYESTDAGEILQKDHRGKAVDRYKVEMKKDRDMVLAAASEKRLLYAVDEEDDDALLTLYHCPVEQTKSGEKVLWNQGKELARVEFDISWVPILQLEEPYLVYYDGKALVRLNLDTEEKKTFDFEDDGNMESSLMAGSEKGCLYFHADNLPESEIDREEGANDSLYRIDVEEWRKEKIYSNQDSGYDVTWEAPMKDDMIFPVYWTGYPDFEKIECYDVGQKKILGRISGGDLEKFLEEKNLYGEKYKAGHNLFVDFTFEYGDRLYIVCDYDKESRTNSTEPYVRREILLSCPKENMSNLSYEEDVSEWWYGNAEEEKVCDEFNDGRGAATHHMGGFIIAFENELYFSYRNKKDHSERLMLYDLETGKMQEVREKELAYQALHPLFDTEYSDYGE